MIKNRDAGHKNLIYNIKITLAFRKKKLLKKHKAQEDNVENAFLTEKGSFLHKFEKHKLI